MYPQRTFLRWRDVDGSSMIYLKSLLAGIAAALLVIVLFVMAVFVIPLLLQFVIPLLLQFGTTGSGGIGAVSYGVSGLALALIVTLAFAGGFYWEFRRASRRKSSLTH
jgi:hypothetical protein